MKSPGGVGGLPVSVGTDDERFTYSVSTIGVTNTAINPTYSGMPVTNPPGVALINQANARQVAILQMTDAYQTIIGPPVRPWFGQAYFYGTVPGATSSDSGNSTNARGISVWPAANREDTRIAICGETNDQAIPYSQFWGEPQNGWSAWSANNPRWSGFIAVYDGNCSLLWSHQFFGRSATGDCAITDVSIRVVGEGEVAEDVVTYCGISSHGVDLDGAGQPTAANGPLTPVAWYPNVTPTGEVDNGSGQWDGIVGRLTNSHANPRTTNNRSNAATVFHSVVGGNLQDGLFGIAELPDDRFVVVGSTGTGAAGTSTNAFPFMNPPAATSSSYSLGTALVFQWYPSSILILEASSPIGSAGSELHRYTVARDVAVQLDAVRADPVHGANDPSHVIYIVGSTDDEALFTSVGATATAQTQINGNGNQGAADGFLLAARDRIPTLGYIDFDKGSYHGSNYDDGLCGVACWNEYLDHVSVSGFWSTSTGGTGATQVDLEVGSYFTDTTVSQSTAIPVVVSDLVRIRRDNIAAAGDQVPAAMGLHHATQASGGLLFEVHDLGSPAGGGIAVEDRARVNIVGQTPPNSPYLVHPAGSPNARTFLGGSEAVRTAVDLVPDVSQFVGVGRTDGTGQDVPVVSGSNGGTTPSTNLLPYGRQIGMTPPGLQRLLLDWEGGMNNPCALLVDRPPFGSNIVAAFLHYGIPANPVPNYPAFLPGVELWCDPSDPLTTSISQFFFPGTDQSVRFPLTLPPGTGHIYIVQAVCMLSNGTFAGSPGMLFRF